MSLITQQYNQQAFDTVVNHLKSRKALSNDSFVHNLPFFTFSAVSKESHIKELFQSKHDANAYIHILENITSQLGSQLPAACTSNQVMSFAQIVLYKVLPCPDGMYCQKSPREVITQNQYTDAEYECPFYHHERDRRRLIINTHSDEEFEYKANYFDEGRRGGASDADREKFSQNYFESMFHPMYYKLFRCHRTYCQASEFCPYFHNDQEKTVWDSYFSEFMMRDRVSFIKDKQKYYQNSSDSSPSQHKSSKQSRSTIMKEGYQNGSSQARRASNFEQKRNQRFNGYSLQRWNN